MSKLKHLTLLSLYMPLLVVFNPVALSRIYHSLFPTWCKRICSLRDTLDDDVNRHKCRPVNPSCLVFLRTTKTSTTTLRTLFQTQTEDKSTLVVGLGEFEDVVTSILAIMGVGGHSRQIEQGYHNPSLEATRAWLILFYAGAVVKMLRSTFRGRERQVFHGHLP